MTIRRLVLLRHGETNFNTEGRMQGQRDTELTDLGRRQAADVAATLAKLDPLLIVSSDLRRARETAQALAEQTGQPIRIDPRLREMHLGHWQGLTEPEIDSAAPGSRRQWHDDPTWARHGGESRVDVAERALPVVEHLVMDQPDWGGDEPDRPVVLTAHNAVIAALTAALLGLPVENWPALGGLSNASWVQLSGHSGDSAADGIRWRMDVWNATARVASEVL
ncbi:MAG: histidine phosphatase family protein [Mycobacterium sp.]